VSVGYFRPEHLPRDPEGRERRQDARLLLLVAEAQLRDPALVAQVDVGALARLAQDGSLPARTQRRAATALARVRLAALDGLAAARGTPGDGERGQRLG